MVLVSWACSKSQRRIFIVIIKLHVIVLWLIWKVFLLTADNRMFSTLKYLKLLPWRDISSLTSSSPDLKRIHFPCASISHLHLKVRLVKQFTLVLVPPNVLQIINCAPLFTLLLLGRSILIIFAAHIIWKLLPIFIRKQLWSDVFICCSHGCWFWDGCLGRGHVACLQLSHVQALMRDHIFTRFSCWLFLLLVNRHVKYRCQTACILGASESTAHLRAIVYRRGFTLLLLNALFHIHSSK